MPVHDKADEPAQVHGRGEPLWSIHYLRALAAFGVILFHTFDDTPWPFELGAAGIHLFFTISGFVIWTSAKGRRIGPGSFAAARLTRIVPQYWLATLVAVLSTFVMPGYFWQATAEPFHVVASLLFIPHEGVSGGIYPVLYQGWTLQYEMYFYAVFGLCLFLPTGARGLAIAGWFITATAAGAVFQPAGAALQTYTNPICLEFLAGMGAAGVAQWAGDRLPRPALIALALVGGVAFVLIDLHESALGWSFNLLLPTATVSVIVGLVGLELSGWMVRSRWLRLAGEASYSTYLFQTLGFALVVAILPHTAVGLRVILFIVSAQGCGILIFRYVETPLLSRVRQFARATAQTRPTRQDNAAALMAPNAAVTVECGKVAAPQLP